MGDISIFLLSVLLSVMLLFLAVYFIITLSDLECDYINARTCCDKLNKFVIPELVLRSLPTVILLLTGHWILFLMNFPLNGWYILKYFKKPANYIGLFDPAEIHNRGELKTHSTNSMIKLGEHLIFFFIYLYCLIMALVNSK